MVPGLVGTVSGKQVNVLDFKVSDFNFWDIAISLSNINRFNGHTLQNWSVLQHCIFCHEVALFELGYVSYEHLSLGLLLHDSAEAYISDIPTPLKVLKGFDSIQDLEDTILLKLYESMDLIFTKEDLESIHQIDKLTGQIEMLHLRPQFTYDTKTEFLKASKIKESGITHFYDISRRTKKDLLLQFYKLVEERSPKNEFTEKFFTTSGYLACKFLGGSI